MICRWELIKLHSVESGFVILFRGRITPRVISIQFASHSIDSCQFDRPHLTFFYQTHISVLKVSRKRVANGYRNRDTKNERNSQCCHRHRVPNIKIKFTNEARRKAKNNFFLRLTSRVLKSSLKSSFTSRLNVRAGKFCFTKSNQCP